MPKHIKRIECCYCGASALINLSNPNEMRLICSGCGGRMSVDKLSALSVAEPAQTPVKREVRFDPPAQPDKRWKDFDEDDDDDDRKDRRRKPKRKTFLKRLEDKLEDIWDEIEDIFD